MEYYSPSKWHTNFPLPKKPITFGKRQDYLTKSRFFMWKPALSSAQIYPNVKTQAIPLNFNRYGIPPPPMAPIHQNYMFAIPTKMNNYPSYQPVKEIDDKRKLGNLHHITIINAIMPKPYLPTVPTHSHPTTTFRNYRTNNKLLYHPYYNNNFGRQNLENLNKINVQQLQLQQLQQHQQQQQQQHLQMVYPSSPLALKTNTPTMDYRHIISYNTKNNNIEHEESEINTKVSPCGRKTKNDTNHSASDVLFYYCNNRITNYKNPTQQQALVSIQPTATSTSTSTTTTTTTTEAAPPTTIPHSTKSARSDFDFFTTERPIFLPTPNAPMDSSFTPITSTTKLKNSVVDLENDNNINLQRQKYRRKKYEDIPPQQQRHRQTATRYDDIKRQQQYTTAAAATYDDMKFHSFFTIEDAVTRAPEMQVFNDPYQAYRHARRHHHSHQRQTTTTTINPDTTTTSKKPKYKSFFDDLEEEDYIIPEVNQYDYSLFGTPAKSAYHKSKLQNGLKFSEHNQILDHTHKPTEEIAFFELDEPFQGKPKIKEHHFGLFNAIGSTTYTTPAITTYKPYENLRNHFLTTHKIPSSSSHDSKPITFTTTTDTVLRNQETLNERENTTSNIVFSNEVRTSTTIPITTTTEKKSNKIIFKSPLNLRSSSTAFKYPKQSRIHKSYKNITSTTTRATPSLKKVPKYQRQYKTKKLKEFKHLFTTSSTTTSTTTTTAIPTTTEIPTKRISLRVFPTTSTTEEPTTKKAVITRTVLTTETTKIKKIRKQPPPTTETTNRKKIKSRISTAPPIAAVNDNTTRRQSPRRGSKRADISRSEKESVQPTTRKTENKNRRRPSSSSTTAKPLITRTSSNLSSTSTTSSTPISTTSLRTSSTTTTMKSIMRIANSKSRTKHHHNGFKSPIKPLNEMKDDRQAFDERMSLKSITATMANIPPLPIEIYFKKSHSAKM